MLRLSTVLTMALCLAAPAGVKAAPAKAPALEKAPAGKAPAVKASAAKASAAKSSAPKPAGKKLKDEEAKWYTSFLVASKLSKEQDKPILAYFYGSDWCEWSIKLDKEVIRTDLFLDWAKENVILLEVDFPAHKKQSPQVKGGNEKLKKQYNIIKTPTLLFLDYEGSVIARAGYDKARLLETEEDGKPEAWVKFADEAVKNRPKPEKLILQEGLAAGMAYAKKHNLPLLILSGDPLTARWKETAEALLNSQKFIRFVNRNMAFTKLPWPAKFDQSSAASAFNAFVQQHAVTPAPAQLIVWHPQNNKVRANVTAFSVTQLDNLLERLEKELPAHDYGGAWLEDWRLAQAIAAQMKRDTLLLFTSSDGSEWSQKFEAEVFKQEEFKRYASKNLVLMRVDFPKKAPQAEALREQNRMLADTYAIRGYPTAVFLNPKGEKMGDSKYMKGGPGPFIKALDTLRRRDEQRRTLLSEELAQE